MYTQEQVDEMNNNHDNEVRFGAAIADHLAVNPMRAMIRSIGSYLQGIDRDVMLEANDRVTRSRVRHETEDFIRGFQNTGLIEDYYVKCDEENNPSSVIEDNRLITHFWLTIQPKHMPSYTLKFKHSAGVSTELEDAKFLSAVKPDDVIDVDFQDITGSAGSSSSTGGGVGSSGAWGHTTKSLSAAGSASGKALISPAIAGVGVSSGGPVAKSVFSTQPDLPSIVFQDFDDSGTEIMMTLQPESTIGAAEALKLSLMLHVTLATGTSGFLPYGFIKKNNLERHFKFEQR